MCKICGRMICPGSCPDAPASEAAERLQEVLDAKP